MGLDTCVPVNEEEESENPGCKNINNMLSENTDLEVECKINGKGQYICKLNCPTGTNFMGKDGKTGTKLTCKCKNEKCIWKTDKNKTVNGKKMKTYTCK